MAWSLKASILWWPLLNCPTIPSSSILPFLHGPPVPTRRCPATGPPSGQCALYNVPAIDGTAGNSGSIVTNCSVRPIVTQDADGAVVAALAR
jgi:hypothetical protein